MIEGAGHAVCSRTAKCCQCLSWDDIIWDRYAGSQLRVTAKHQINLDKKRYLEQV